MSSYENHTAILDGRVWENDRNGFTIYYNFLNSVPSYYSETAPERDGFTSLTTAMKQIFSSIFREIEKFTKLTFTTSTSTNHDTEIAIGMADLGFNEGGHAFFPGTGPRNGDVWLNTYYIDDNNFVPGKYGYYVAVHELGHALGLKHPFLGNDVLPENEDNTYHTVMSYNFEAYPHSYMMYDIAALQELYGANTEYRTGNNIYKIDTQAVTTIWDAGGIDTINGNTLTEKLYVNLNEGSFVKVNDVIVMGVAFGVTIEKALGGAGDDELIGNAANNTLIGNAGHDILDGKEGSDILEGRSGNDILYGMAGNDKLYGGAGNDNLYGGVGRDTLDGAGGANLYVGGSNGDTFVLSVADQFLDTITDFSLSQKDVLDVSAMVTLYDPLTDAIADFLRFSERDGATYINVDRNGGANSFLEVAVLSNATNLGQVEDLIMSGNLVV